MTFAPAIAAPEVSTTVPPTDVVPVCANEKVTSAKNTAKTAPNLQNVLMRVPLDVME